MSKLTQEQEAQIIKEHLAKVNIPNKHLLAIVGVIFGTILVFALLNGPPVNADDDTSDQLLALEYDYKASLQSQEDLESGVNAFINQAIATCEKEKSIAQFKIANGIEMDRYQELSDKTKWNCMSFNYLSSFR